MTDSESTSKQVRIDDLDARSAFGMDDCEVIKRGQITIEKKHRDAHDLDIGDYVDIEVYHDGDTIRVPDVRIGESGRVTIPARQRNRYGLTEGERVDVGVFLN
jgi:AbrB family looped-hinge helix DNA binding protein